ncbi:hypothetical protein L1987_30028 [Smallanthus sonchifolius]|uniref:Uncharacterized protein n=1 Tax=Smallanthus sonchifolius TaxID=185202 RepID=A0ACB9I372_9ASTR|nr:hypothetical protein L1987_30028 [Smallanthus sonchifolius]
MHVLKFPLPKQPSEDAGEFVINAWNKLKVDTCAISNLMLASMDSEIRKSLRKLSAYDMICNLKESIRHQGSMHSQDDHLIIDITVDNAFDDCNWEGHPLSRYNYVRGFISQYAKWVPMMLQGCHASLISLKE